MGETRLEKIEATWLQRCRVSDVWLAPAALSVCDTSWLINEARKVATARSEALEEAAVLMEAHVVTDGSAGMKLEPGNPEQLEGNREGRLRAAAIRALIERDNGEAVEQSDA